MVFRGKDLSGCVHEGKEQTVIKSGALESLLYPFPNKEFFAKHWPYRPFQTHSLKQTIRPLMNLPLLQNLDSLLNSWPRQVQAHLPDVADEASSIEVLPADARKLYANGMSLLFNNVQDFSDELKAWLAGLRSDLGLPRSTVSRCMVYATPDGSGTATHFDQNVNFVLQLVGSKVWQLCPNNFLSHPTQRHTVGQPVDDELSTYLNSQLPERSDFLDLAQSHESLHDEQITESVTLNPGSLLFVPRGYWHATSAVGPALALNFTFSQPTWIDLFTTALRSRLLLSAERRELADGVSSPSSERRDRATKRFDALLLEIVADLPNWQAAEILAATEGEF